LVKSMPVSLEDSFSKSVVLLFEHEKRRKEKRIMKQL
jgi:putative AlgH/UPF0301 family transcriptional regulator